MRRSAILLIVTLVATARAHFLTRRQQTYGEPEDVEYVQPVEPESPSAAESIIAILPECGRKAIEAFAVDTSCFDWLCVCTDSITWEAIWAYFPDDCEDASDGKLAPRYSLEIYPLSDPTRTDIVIESKNAIMAACAADAGQELIPIETGSPEPEPAETSTPILPTETITGGTTAIPVPTTSTDNNENANASSTPTPDPSSEVETSSTPSSDPPSSSPQPSKSNTAAIGAGAGVGGGVVIIIIVFAFWYRRRRQKAAALTPTSRPTADDFESGNAGKAELDGSVPKSGAGAFTVAEKPELDGTEAKKKALAEMEGFGPRTEIEAVELDAARREAAIAELDAERQQSERAELASSPASRSVASPGLVPRKPVRGASSNLDNGPVPSAEALYPVPPKVS